MTVRQLLMYAEQLVAQGYGNKEVLVSNDDEGNGYHTLYYQFTTNEREIRNCAKAGMFHDNNKPDEVVLLG